MKSAIDSVGRLVIPKRIREEAQLQPGAALEIRWRDGRIEIEPAPLPVRLVRKGSRIVAVPDEGIEALPAETVEETRQAIRRQRGERAKR